MFETCWKLVISYSKFSLMRRSANEISVLTASLSSFSNAGFMDVVLHKCIFHAVTTREWVSITFVAAILHCTCSYNNGSVNLHIAMTLLQSPSVFLKCRLAYSILFSPFFLDCIAEVKKMSIYGCCCHMCKSF